MPPHLLTCPGLFTRLYNRKLSLGLVTAAVLLTGCASTGTQQRSSLDIDANYAELDTDLLDAYDLNVESDPLAALLANRHRSDITISRSSSTSRRNNTAQVSTPSNAEGMSFANTALSFLGVKYRYGGDAPSTGFDCSGLVLYAAEQSLGLKLPRTSADMAKQGKSVSRDELKKGDLVFFNTLGRRYSHVGIYLGEGKFVHSPRTGAVVRVESIHTGYWQKRYNGARRLAESTPEVNADNPRLGRAK